MTQVVVYDWPINVHVNESNVEWAKVGHFGANLIRRDSCFFPDSRHFSLENARRLIHTHSHTHFNFSFNLKPRNK